MKKEMFVNGVIISQSDSEFEKFFEELGTKKIVIELRKGKLPLKNKKKK